MSAPEDPFMLVRSMMLVDFRCPPLPMTGQFVQDGDDTTVNSHDLMGTLISIAFKFSDETKNNTRRQMQEALRERYIQELSEDTGSSFDNTYSIMARHTREYIATYLIDTPFSVSDVIVLAPDRITPHLAREIDHYGRALRIMLMAHRQNEEIDTPSVRSRASDKNISSSSSNPPVYPVLDYSSHNVVKTLLVNCARSAVDYEKEGVIDEPVLKRVCYGVDAEREDPATLE